jgi:hypothetical protein
VLPLNTILQSLLGLLDQSQINCLIGSVKSGAARAHFGTVKIHIKMLRFIREPHLVLLMHSSSMEKRCHSITTPTQMLHGVR